MWHCSRYGPYFYTFRRIDLLHGPPSKKFRTSMKVGLDSGPHPTLTTAQGECKDGLFPLVTEIIKFVLLKASEIEETH